jgi:ABC-type multidrug transport system ATPase subunit
VAAHADTLVDNLTVYEMLLYTAELKRPLKESSASKREAVDMLIEDLNLGACRSTRIGNRMHRGISGGQAWQFMRACACIF